MWERGCSPRGTEEPPLTRTCRREVRAPAPMQSGIGDTHPGSAAAARVIKSVQVASEEDPGDRQQLPIIIHKG